MINFAHRGASGDYPENTLLAFREAIKVGATGFELDVHKTKDNKIVVIHDEDIERTFLGKGLIKDLTLEELQKFKCRKVLFRSLTNCYIPTLEEVLEIVKSNNLILNIELKTDEIHYIDIEKDVIDLVKKYEVKNKIIISSFNPESIKICKDIDSEIKTGFLYCKPIVNVIEKAKKLKANAIHPSFELVSKKLIQKAHENNLEVNIFTVNSPRDMRRVINMKADGIFTDYPGLLNQIISEE